MMDDVIVLPPRATLVGLDRHRARAGLARGDALADDADVLGARARPQRPSAAHGRLVLCRRGDRHARGRRPRRLRARRRRGLVRPVLAEDVGLRSSTSWPRSRSSAGSSGCSGGRANPERTASAVAQVSKVASSPAVAVIGAGAALANPGAFIPIALKTISELDPSNAQYIADWVFFTLMATLPLGLALIALLVAREWAERVLAAHPRLARAERADGRRGDHRAARGRAAPERDRRADELAVAAADAVVAVLAEEGQPAQIGKRAGGVPPDTAASRRPGRWS